MSHNVRRERQRRSVSTSSHGVERTCVGCLQVASKDQLIRLVCSPSGQVLLDIYGKLPGRGAYLCARRRCAEQALQKTRLQEALRRKVSVAGIDELVGAMVGVMMERARSCIRIARKAGRVVSGYTQVGRALTYEPVACLLVAEDTAPDRLREYEGWCAKRRIPCHLFLTKTQLGELAGRDESSALAILEPRLGERLIGYLEGMGRLTER